MKKLFFGIVFITLVFKLFGNTDGLRSTGGGSVEMQQQADAVLSLYYVTGDVVNLRGGPSTGYEILGQLVKATPVWVIEHKNGWAKLARSEAGSEVGWMSKEFLSTERPKIPAQVARASSASAAASLPTRSKLDEAKHEMIRQSKVNYSGNCPCPESRDKAGRRCGKRSAYSRPGGASPLCYPSDIPDQQAQAFLAR